MDLKEFSLSQLEEIRDSIVKENIGVLNKPRQYFKQLAEIDCEINKRLSI